MQFLLFFQLRRLTYLPKYSLYRGFFSKKTPAFLKFPRKDASAYVTANAEESAGTARPRWIGWRFDASLFPANQKGVRVLPFSAAGGMPSAMLAGLADRLSHRRFVRFFSLWYIPQLAPRCATIAFNGSGGVNYTIFTLKAAKRVPLSPVSQAQHPNRCCTAR